MHDKVVYKTRQINCNVSILANRPWFERKNKKKRYAEVASVNFLKTCLTCTDKKWSSGGGVAYRSFELCQFITVSHPFIWRE